MYIPLLLTISDAEKVKTKGGQSAIRSQSATSEIAEVALLLNFLF